MRAVCCASLPLRAAVSFGVRSRIRRVASLRAAPARAMASSPQRAGGASGPAPTPLGASAPGSPRSVAAAAAAVASVPSNPLLVDDLFPRFSEVRRRGCAARARRAWIRARCGRGGGAAPHAAFCGWP